MLGAIIGDIVGSIYEFKSDKTKNFPLFSTGCSPTDDSLMTMAGAIAEAYYGIPDELVERAMEYMDEEQKNWYFEYADELY